MAKKRQIPMFLRVGNMMTTAFLRAGVKFNGFGKSRYPMYLLTVKGRKSGVPRTTPIVTLLKNDRRYLVSPFGIVDWVRNLRAAGEATLTRGRRSETVNAKELPKREAALVLQEDVKAGNPFASYFEVTAESSLEDFERTTISHPVFVLEKK